MCSILNSIDYTFRPTRLCYRLTEFSGYQVSLDRKTLASKERQVKTGKDRLWMQNKLSKPTPLHQAHITKAYLYNFDPLKPHFYIVKLGFTGVYIIFLISAQKHRLWVLVRTASSRRFQRVPTVYVLSRNMKNIRFFI